MRGEEWERKWERRSVVAQTCDGPKVPFKVGIQKQKEKGKKLLGSKNIKRV
jgi:hypothetical protein